MATEKRTWKCSGTCGNEFVTGEWACFPGVKHQVEAKTYYMADAPYVDYRLDPDGMGLRKSHTTLHVIPERTFKDGDGNIVRSAFQPAEFYNGKFETADPEYQYYLESGAAAKSLCTEARWHEVYHTPRQKQFLEGQEIKKQKVELEKLRDETNALLAQVKGKGKTELVSK